MFIPEYLQRPGMKAEEKKRLAAFVESKRKIMRKLPTYKTAQEAAGEAVRTAKKDELSLPSVWKEPQDIGTNHVVVVNENRENAGISGYTETIDQQAIFDMANKVKKSGIEEIEEVDGGT